MTSSILFVRALYDFNSTDVSSLSFRRDDIIQVLTRLESGWWDGLCNGERGWFPSNYVTDLDGEEEMLDENEQAADWIPQQTPDGDVFYFNNRTGESSWALPMDDTESVRSANPRDSSSTGDGINQGNLTSSSNSISTRSTTDSPRSSVLTRSRQLPENWIQQPTEGGNTYYYYNTITKETRWTHPGGGGSTSTNSENDDEKEEEEVDDRVISARVEEEVVEDEADDVEAADKESIASSRGSRLSTSTIGTIQQRQQNQQQQSTNEKLPQNWGKKMTPQGRVYYYNKLTDETTWSLENVDSDGKLIEANNNDSVPNADESSFGGLGDNESPHEIPLPPTPTAAIPPPQPEPSILMMQNPNEALTWGSLSNTVFLAIHNLNLAAKENSKQDYKNSTNAIVESIRIMLYASGTVEKESPAIRQNRSLKIYHRHIMASLSKLVLSTKVASGVWPPPDAAQKMKSDADEVLVAVRQFVHAAEHTVNIRRVDPKILESATGGAWRGNNLPLAIDNNSKSHGTNPQENGGDSLPSSPTSQNPPSRSLTPDLLASLDHTSRTVTKAITLLQNHIRKYLETPRVAMSNNSATFVQLISQTRQTITQVGQFLSLIEDINLEDLDEASQGTVNEFKIAKQALYNNIAELVICTQSATDLSAPLNAVDKVQASTSVVEKSVKDVIIATKFLVEEKEAQDQLRINVRVPRRPSNVEVPPNKRRVISSIVSPNSTLVSLDQIQESGADGVVNADVVEGDQPVVNGTPVVSTALQTVPEDDVMLTDSSTIAGDQASTIDDYDIPMSPISDGSSMTGGHSVKSIASSRFRSDSSISSSAFDAASVQSHPPPLLRANTQPSIPTDFSNSSSPPASNAGGAKSPRAENSNKVKQFFGEDVPSGVAQTCGQREDKPSFLNYDYDASEIVFNMESHVKGGTLNALGERLTMHDVLDSNFIATFLLTYRSFCTTDEFFDMLVKRFMVQQPDNLTREEGEVWVEKKQTPIRLRVFNIMKSWLENYYIEREDSHCLVRMREFVSTVMQENMAFAANSLTKVIDKRQQLDKVPTFKVMVLTNAVPPPQSILPKNMKKIKFLDLDPLEIARQLTIMESKLYNKIQPVECLNKAWSKEEGVGGEVAENIKAMIVNSNQITGWVAESILNQPEIKKRCSLIKHFVAVADKCRALNNFNSLTAIISGLNSAPIHRLKRTWEMVNARTIQTLENMNRIMNSTKNFSDYREILHSINPPCVPFLGVYLTDLTFIEDGNPNIIKKTRQLINFSKRMKTAEVIREIQQYQSIPYSLNPVHDIQIFIQSHLQDSKDVADLYTQSLNMEPREREDEKIARLLQESGFL